MVNRETANVKRERATIFVINNCLATPAFSLPSAYAKASAGEKIKKPDVETPGVLG